jgi:hypothetical protein
MTPIDIGPHPDAPEHYWPMGKPKNMTDEQCMTLMVRRVGATPDMIKETPVRIVNAGTEQEAYPGFLSEWTPTPEELERLNAGYPVRMLIVGDGLPPSNLWVRGTDEL